MPQPDRLPTPKLDCFEAIRGLAALAVVFSHVLIAFWPWLVFRVGPHWEATPYWLQAVIRFPVKFLTNGGMAVTLFFVLSGFVLSLSFFKKGDPAPLGPAALRRYPRLMIPAAASIFLTLVALSLGLVRNRALGEFLVAADGTTVEAVKAAGTGPTNPWGWLLLWYDFAPDAGVALRQSVWDAFTGTASYNLVLWTMPIELAGSFLVFAFLALFGASRRRAVAYAMVAAVTVAFDAKSFLPGEFYLLDFLLGVALCDLWIMNQRTWRWTLPLVPAVALVAVGLFALPGSLKPLSAVLIIGATAASPALQRALSGGWLAVLGRLSFSLYLVHMVVLCSVGCGVYLGLCRDLGWSHPAASLAGAAATVLGSFLVAWGFYHLADRPAIILTRRLDRWLADVPPAEAPAEPARRAA